MQSFRPDFARCSISSQPSPFERRSLPAYRIPMSIPGLDGTELIAWVNDTASRWQELFAAHPEALQLPCGIRETTTVLELLQHIAAVELRYAERLSDLPETPYTGIPGDSAQAIDAVHRKAMSMLAALSIHDDTWWSEWLEFATRSAGVMRAPRRTILVHLLMHSIRHYAQLATLLREHGIAPGWMMDYLGMRPGQV